MRSMGSRRFSSSRCRWSRAALAGLLGAALVVTSVHAHADPLLDLLHDKKILTDAELRRVQQAPLAAPQRAALIDVLRDKGLLSAREAERVQNAAQPAQAAAKPAPTPVAAMPAQGVAPSTIPAQSVAPGSSPQVPGPVAQAAAAAAEVGYKDGFFLRSSDGNFALRLNGRVASNVVADEPDTAVRDNITIDRARLSADATFYTYFRGRVEGDFASSSVLRDAYLAVQPRPEFNLQIGQFPVPFSYELGISKLRSDFVERSVVVTQTVNPRRDVGAMVYGTVAGGTLQYQLAVMNGAGQNRADNNSAKDFIGRLVVSPFATWDNVHLAGFNFGGAVSYGNQPAEFTKNASGDLVPVGDSIFGASETGFTFFPAIARDGARLRGDAHVAWLDGPYSITSEYIHTSEERNGLGAGGSDLSDLDTDGAYVGGTWLLTGETKVLNARVRPLRPLWSGPTPGYGAWELALRYEFFELGHDPDPSSTALSHNRYDAGLAGINWYPNEFLRLSLNYVYSVYDHKGTNASPDPDEHSNNAVLGRAQVDF